MGRRSDFSRSGYADSTSEEPQKHKGGGTGLGEILLTTVKLLLIFCMVRITMLISGITFISVPVFDPPLRRAVVYLKVVTDKVERFWAKYR